MIFRKDKDKLILIFYVNICGLEKRDFVNSIYNYAKDAFDNSVKIIVLPINDSDEPRYRVEAINPKLITEDEYKKVKFQLEEIEKKYNKEFNI